VLRAALVSVALAAATGTAAAQGYFGQTQVQYDHFDWRVKETEHFLIHYYPEEAVAANDAARMAERAYGKLSRLIGYQFREKKPLVFFASRTDFGQNNVTGDLGEGVGGVTEGLRHRVLLPFTGDYQSFEQVLTHELVHSFQYDIFARGKAGAGLQTLNAVNPPSWFMEGMAEYLSTGPGHHLTEAWLRDAALNGNFPSIEEMTDRPDQYFPYRYGEALWEYIGQRWGDEAIGQILLSTPNVGVERAIKRETGLSLEDLSDEWRDAMQEKHLPQIPSYQRPRKFATPMLNQRRTGAEIFLAPSLSPDGKYIAFISTGSFLRGEVFFDLWLGDAATGKRIKRLVKSTTNPDVEELRLIYSQSAFSPDGRVLAYTGQRHGKDVLYLLDVKKRKTTLRFDLPLEGILSPSFSPDGKRIVFSGNRGGITDLYIVDADGKNLRRLTDDRYGDLQPQWSPDGKTIAFASERGEGTNLDLLQFNRWRLTLLDLDAMRIEVVPNQNGLNLNPMWAPDSKSIAYVSDRTGIANVFLYDVGQREHYQLTNVVGSISAIAEYSPAITWARGADRLAFTYYEDGGYTVWATDNPRSLRKAPYRDPIVAPKVIADAASSGAPGVPLPSTVVAAIPPITQAVDTIPVATRADSTVRRQSIYRGDEGFRAADELPAAERGTAPLTVAQLLDSAAFALPDTTRFKDYHYKVRFLPEYIGQPQIGYAQDNFGRGVYGGTTLILSDMLGNHRLTFAGGLNGRLADAQVFAAYTSMQNRLQYITGLLQEPYYFYSGDQIVETQGSPIVEQQQLITRYVQRQAFGIAQYPINRFTRFEVGLSYNNVDRSTIYIIRQIDTDRGVASPFYMGPTVNEPGLNYVQPNAAYVSDNTLFGYTGPIMGRRYRFQVTPTLGSFQWMEYLADYRRYDPIIFNFITIATRFTTRMAVGRDERETPSYIGRPELLRGYNRESCSQGVINGDLDVNSCAAARLIGSRVAIANAEVRFPLIRQFYFAVIPFPLPPVDGLAFYDVGLAWSGDNQLERSKPSSGDLSNVRYPLRSYGFGLRVNLFNFALARWDYAIPLDIDRKGFWTFSLGPSF
jgi:Tol biopolymer transport system component